MVNKLGKHPAEPRSADCVSLRALACAIGILCSLPGAAAAQQDAGWPCIQPKVPHLAVAQLWSGPPLPETADWRDDPELAHLVSLIAARRTDVEEVAPMLEALGPAQGRSRDERLLMLFAGVFQTIDRERARIIAGVERYAERQRGLARQIDATEDAIRAAEAAASPEDHDAQDRIEEMQDALAWDIRIFQDRRQALTYVCESPVILERRAFAAARLIQSELGQ
jgi:hypothetical protein